MRRDDFSVIYSGNIVQADLLKCLLEGEGMQAFLEDEFLGRMVPYAAAAGGAGAVKVLIANSDLDQARMIVDEVVRDMTTETTEDRTWKVERIRKPGPPKQVQQVRPVKKSKP